MGIDVIFDRSASSLVYSLDSWYAFITLWIYLTDDSHGIPLGGPAEVQGNAGGGTMAAEEVTHRPPPPPSGSVRTQMQTPLPDVQAVCLEESTRLQVSDEAWRESRRGSAVYDARPFHVGCRYTCKFICRCPYGMPKGIDERAWAKHAHVLWQAMVAPASLLEAREQWQATRLLSVPVLERKVLVDREEEQQVGNQLGAIAERLKEAKRVRFVCASRSTRNRLYALLLLRVVGA